MGWRSLRPAPKMRTMWSKLSRPWPQISRRGWAARQLQRVVSEAQCYQSLALPSVASRTARAKEWVGAGYVFSDRGTAELTLTPDGAPTSISFPHALCRTTCGVGAFRDCALPIRI